MNKLMLFQRICQKCELKWFYTSYCHKCLDYKEGLLTTEELFVYMVPLQFGSSHVSQTVSL